MSSLDWVCQVQESWCMEKALYPWQQGKQKKASVHSLAYFLSNPEQIGWSGDCSHRCHNSLCVNAAHLFLEPHSINNNRQICISTNKCTEHALYPDCLLEWHLPVQVCITLELKLFLRHFSLGWQYSRRRHAPCWNHSYRGCIMLTAYRKTFLCWTFDLYYTSFKIFSCLSV